jgi:hypothetical protein
MEHKPMLEKIGIRENFAKYIKTASPIAVTRHDRTVGYFFPTHQAPSLDEIEGLKRAADALDRLLQEQGMAEDALVQEYRQLREQNP